MPDYQIHPSLKWASLTGAINEMRVVTPFLRDLLYSRVQPLATEDVELSVYSSNREIAPFVRKNGEGIMTTGHSENFQTVQAPNIRIKRPFTPSDLLYTRRPGTSVFPTVQQHRQARTWPRPWTETVRPARSSLPKSGCALRPSPERSPTRWPIRKCSRSLSPAPTRTTSP